MYSVSEKVIMGVGIHLWIFLRFCLADCNKLYVIVKPIHMTLSSQGIVHLDYFGFKNRTMFSKISLNLVIVGFCCHGNRQSNCRTGCLEYAFESLVCLLLVDMNCCEGIFILCSWNKCELKTLVLKIGF